MMIWSISTCLSWGRIVTLGRPGRVRPGYLVPMCATFGCQGLWIFIYYLVYIWFLPTWSVSSVFFVSPRQGKRYYDSNDCLDALYARFYTRPFACCKCRMHFWDWTRSMNIHQLSRSYFILYWSQLTYVVYIEFYFPFRMNIPLFF